MSTERLTLEQARTLLHRVAKDRGVALTGVMGAVRRACIWLLAFNAVMKSQGAKQ